MPRSATSTPRAKPPRSPSPKPGPEHYASDLEYLEHELRWIESRCMRIGARRRLVGHDSDDPFETPSRRDRDPISLRRAAAHHGAEETRLRAEIDERLAASRHVGVDLALDRMCGLHGLSEDERVIVLLAAAICVSKRFEMLYGLLDQESYGASRLAVEAIFNFLEFDFSDRVRRRTLFSATSPLFTAELLTLDTSRRALAPEDLLGVCVQMPTRTFNYVLGDDALGDELGAFSSLEPPRATLEQVVLDPADKRRILSVVENHDRYLACREAWGVDEVIRYGRGMLMLFHGKPGTGKTMMAHAVADRLGKRIFNVDIPAFLQHAEAHKFLPALFREARLQNAVLFFDECETLFADRLSGNVLMTLLLTEIERFEGVAILATNLPQFLDEALDRRLLVKVGFPEPDRAARLEIWRKHVPARMPLSDDVDLEALAGRYECSGGYIKNAVLMAVAGAVHDGGDHPRVTMEHFENAIRQQLRKATTDADTRGTIVQPRSTLDDVVLSPGLRERVHEVVEAARNRRMVLESWGIGRNLSYGKGLAVLFHGEPGTGKTMCAEAVANALHRPLMVASVPSIQSKWVGEAEKNLQALFRDARAHNAVLFLDEADSLLAARGSGRASRHDDSAVNVLLQLIERHEGLVILATNLVDRLDPALDRRLHERLGFELPDASERAQIWRGLIPTTAPMDETIDFVRLGRKFPMSGGYIRNAVFKAAFRAARRGHGLTQALLEDAGFECAPASHQVARVVGFGNELH